MLREGCCSRYALTGKGKLSERVCVDKLRLGSGAGPMMPLSGKVLLELDEDATKGVAAGFNKRGLIKVG